MLNNYLSLAIQKLKPNSQYTFKNHDYLTIQWIVLEGKAPTQAEIDSAIEEIKADEAQAVIDKVAAKAAAQAKLAALGLTVEDIQALGL